MDRRSPRELGYRGFQVLAYVRASIAEQGAAPSYSMICDHLGISTKGEVARIVGSLEKVGLVNRAGAGRVRRIRLPA